MAGKKPIKQAKAALQTDVTPGEVDPRNVREGGSTPTGEGGSSRTPPKPKASAAAGD